MPWATNNESMKVRVTSEGFTVEMTKNNVKATLTGTREKNKGVPQQVRIQDGDTVIETRDMTQVPEQYRPLLDRMLRSVGAGPAQGPARVTGGCRRLGEPAPRFGIDRTPWIWASCGASVVRLDH